MRSLTSFLIAGALVTPLGAQQWQHLQGGRVLDVFTRDGQNAWTAEDGGRIRHTADGGATWSFQAVPDDVRAPLHGVFFLDDGLSGWAVGEQGVVLGTGDGGVRWQRLNAEPVPDALHQPAKLHDVHFLDGSRGWVVGADLVLQRTLDGGATWTPALVAAHGYDPDLTPPDYYAVTFLDAHTGFVAGGQGLLLVTHDGGELWDRADLLGVPPNVALWDVEFSGWRGYAVGGVGNQQGWRLLTVDGGQTWVRDSCSLALGTHTTSQYGLTIFEQGGSGLSCGYGSEILLKHEAGDGCWSDALPFTGQGNGSVPLRAASGDELQTAFVVGEFGTIRRTTDKGATWENQGTTMALRPGAVHAVSERVAFVAGQSQRIALTTDEGRTWADVHAGPGASHFRSIALDGQGRIGVAAGEAWAGGATPLLVSSHDEGQSWQDAAWPAGVPVVDLLAVTLRRDGVAWAAGAGGVLLASHDDGQTWVDRSTAAIPHTLEAIAFGSDPQRGFLVSVFGAWRTDDGGDSWIELPILAGGGVGRLRDVFVHGSSDAWAVGNAGEVYRYDPGEDAFRRVGLPFTVVQRLTAVQAVSSSTAANGLEVFVVGHGGVALHHDGSGWSQPKSHTSQDLVDLSFVSATRGLAAGSQTFTIQEWR